MNRQQLTHPLLVLSLVVAVGIAAFAIHRYSTSDPLQPASAEASRAEGPPLGNDEAAEPAEVALDPMSGVRAAEQRLSDLRRKYPESDPSAGNDELMGAEAMLSYQYKLLNKLRLAIEHTEKALVIGRASYARNPSEGRFDDLHTLLNNVAFLSEEVGDLGLALQYYEEAYALTQRRYPADKFPDGHPNLAMLLNNIASVQFNRGEIATAMRLAEDATRMYRRLYPPETHPQGHDGLARSINSIGYYYEELGDPKSALVYYQEALEMYRGLSPKAPADIQAEYAGSYNNVAGVYEAQGNYALARSYNQRALEMREKLFPVAKFPDGHPDLADAYNNLAHFEQRQGEFTSAVENYQRARRMVEKLYPAEDFPRGHTDVARAISNLALAQSDLGNYEEGLRLAEEAVAMRSRMHPVDEFPRGHQFLAIAINNLATIQQNSGNYEQALALFERALEMTTGLYPEAEYPAGHPELARAFNNQAGILKAMSRFDEALLFAKKSLDMHRTMYPAAGYAYGHPQLALAQMNYARVLFERGDSIAALAPARETLSTLLNWLREQASATSETSGLNLVSRTDLEQGVSLLLQTSAATPDVLAADYELIAFAKATVSQAARRRARAAALLTQVEAKAKLQELQSVRLELSRLYSSGPVEASPERRARLEATSQRKENLERELATLSAEYELFQKAQFTTTAIVEALPEKAVFIDIHRYSHTIRNSSGPRVFAIEPRYVAFVVTRGAPIQRVELGACEPVDAALRQWRRAIDRDPGSNGAQEQTASARPGELLWTPLEKAMPAEIQTVLISPDGILSTLPWAALPGPDASRLLVEEFAIALIPDAAFLVEQNAVEDRSGDNAEVVLAVGDVQYNERPAAPRPGTSIVLRGSVTGASRDWSELPNTSTEIKFVQELAGSREVRVLSGREASAQGVLEALPGCRTAHLVTHGYFAPADDPKTALKDAAGVVKRPSENERSTLAQRNPLLLSGLVFAGANVPTELDADGISSSDSGILTAEAIAGLDLHRLDLGVLSACETGLGEIANGEGVFGLQRAFHTAGADAIVASLWKVEDAAGAVVMREFYRALWEERQDPVQALRTAQLYVLRHPEEIAAVAGVLPNPDRGVGKRPVAVDEADVAKPSQESEDPNAPPRATTRQWAAFTISGVGQ